MKVYWRFLVREQARQTRGNQRGAALVAVLFLVVILSFIVLSIAELTGRSLSREAQSRSFHENYWRAVGLTPLAQKALEEAIKAQPGALSRANPIFGEVFTLPMESAVAYVAFSDATRCLDVNRFSKDPTSNDDAPTARSQSDAVRREEFLRLAQHVGLSSGEAGTAFASIVDWIDADDFQEPGGAEDGYYSLLPTPYRTGGGPLVDKSELRALSGVSAEFYARAGFYLCARPSRPSLAMNVNHLTIEDAPLLAALMGPQLALSQAREAIEAIPPSGYADIEEFWTSDGIAGLNDAAELRARLNQRLDVNSGYVAARGVIEQDAGSVELNLLFKVESDKVELLSRRLGRRG